MEATGAPLPENFENGGWYYRFHRRIGGGGFGTVYEVEREKDGGRQRVAIKVLESGRDGGGARGRFLDELTLLLRLDHPAFPRVYELVTVAENEAVVMELVTGRSLMDFDERSLPESVVAEIGAEVAAALHDAWEFVPRGEIEPLRLLHRDLKPPNLMVERTGRVRVLDLGAARSAPEYRGVETQRDGIVPVTPAYVPPEVVQSVIENGWSGRLPPSPAEDVYSLGATLLALATGASYPNEIGLSWKAHARICREYGGTHLRPVLATMLAREPRSRPSMAEVERRLRAVSRAAAGPTVRDWTEQGFSDAPPLELRQDAPVPVPAPDLAMPRRLSIPGLALSMLASISAIVLVVFTLSALPISGTPAPGTPAPGTPAPGTPAPGTPAPGTPAPETPAPETPIVPVQVALVDESVLPERPAATDPKSPIEAPTLDPNVPDKTPVVTPLAPTPPPAKSATGLVIAEASAKCVVKVGDKVLVPRVETAIPAGPVAAVCVWETLQPDGTKLPVERSADFTLAAGETKHIRCRRETETCTAQ